ncbi:MAG: DUF4440 domain-containing protein [Candidatus Aminicenantes bacterium]|nr:DUF4440 domain-containing protein [Candidatus Aminicenantes bacterium]
MLRIVLFVVALGMIAFTGACQSKKSQNDQEALAGIEELHRRDIAASKARDYETLLSLWTDNGVLLLPGRKPIVGKEALKAYTDEQTEISRTYKITKYEHRWEEIKVIGDWAFEWGFYEAEAEMIKGGEIIRDQGKLLRILRKQKDGSWKAARAISQNDQPAAEE